MSQSIRSRPKKVNWNNAKPHAKPLAKSVNSQTLRGGSLILQPGDPATWGVAATARF
jgi:hypothetical protein